MQERMLEAMRGRRPTVESHITMAPFEESEDIQDFLEAFEGIMNMQRVDSSESVLRLTPLFKGKARTVCIDVGSMTAYEGVKKAILSQYSVSPERCRKEFRMHAWTRDAEPNAWIAKGKKLMNRWLRPEDGMEQVLNKIAVEQFINALPQELRIWVASHSPDTPTAIAELIESYDSAHSPLGNKVRTHQSGYKPPWKAGIKDSPKHDKGKKEGLPRSRPGETKPLSEIVCYKCNKKGHLARNCTEKTFHAQEKADKSYQCLFGSGLLVAAV